MTQTTTIDTATKQINNRIDRFAARIPGKPTVAKIMNMFLVVPENERPSKEYVKSYLKEWWS